MRSIAPYYDRAYLSLFQLFRIPARAKYAAVCERAHLIEPQCAYVIDRIPVAIERMCTDCYISAYLCVCDRSQFPALERTSTGCTNRPEAVYVSIFIFFIYFCLIISLSLIIYLVFLFLFIYLLLLVFVNLILFCF